MEFFFHNFDIERVNLLLSLFLSLSFSLSLSLCVCIAETDVIVEMVASFSFLLSPWNPLCGLNLLLQRLWFRITIITDLEVEP